jgi:hypothetical protein
MRSDSSDTIVRLGMATIIVQRGRQTERLSVHTASLVVTSGRQPIHLVLGGPTGSVTVQLSRTAFWRLTGQFHERSIVADARPRQLPRRTPRQPS